MAAIGYFNLIINKGKEDLLINNNDTLIKNIKKNPNEPLKAVLKTHDLLIHSKFKPFVNSGYEYQKVKSKGDYLFGNSVYFSIPQYGEFINDVVANVRISKAEFEEKNIPKPGDSEENNYYPRNGENWNGEPGNYSYTLFNHFNEPVSSNSYCNLISYCEFPGERIFEKVAFSVNGNPLDEYCYNVASMMRDMTIPENKLTGYRKIIGQNEILQTPKFAHEKTNLWIPLLFWFCKDVSVAFPSVAIPSGQRFIHFNIAKSDKIFQETPYLYIVQTRIENGKTYYDKRAWKTTSNLDVTLELLELYANNIFVPPEIHEMYINNITTSLIRVYQIHKMNLKKERLINLNQIKWPAEFMIIGFRPDWNVSLDNPNYWRSWHRFSRSFEIEVDKESNIQEITFSDTGSNNKLRNLNKISYNLIPFKEKYYLDFPIINRLILKSQKIEIHDHESIFYESIHTRKFIRQPNNGLMLIDFRLSKNEEKTDQNPSGSLNFSRNRKVELCWTSDFTNPVELIVTCQSLNMVIVSNGSASLKFAV